jgi:Protein of unknown function (DUF1559)
MKMRRYVELSIFGIVFCALLTLAVWIPNKTRIPPYSDVNYLPPMALRNLGYAMHAYHEKNGRLPPVAIFDKDGRPLLSWRVLLLPYLDQEELFRQFKLDEPWDSPHNIALLPKMPWDFAPLPGVPPLGPNTTPFQVLVGKGTAFEGREGMRLKDDIPRSSYTLLIVEAHNGVPWTKPQDVEYRADEPLPKLGRFFKGRAYGVMADGVAVCIHESEVKESTLRASILRNGDGPLLWDDR